MISILHEDLVDEIRFQFNRFMHKHDYGLRDNVGFVAEAIVANIFTGLRGIGLIADGYIFPNDGFGVIPVEVGSVKPGKWAGIMSIDEKPVRVFRVDFDRSVWMLNERETNFEKQLLTFYKERLDPSFYSLPLFP